MSEGGLGLESLSAPGGAEMTQESLENFQEQYRQSQAAFKQIKREEGSKKNDDSALAQIIVQFLNNPKYTHLFVLISRLVGRSIPSDLILALLALIYEPARNYIVQKFSRETLSAQLPALSPFSQKMKPYIDDWVRLIFLISEREKEAARIVKNGFDEGKPCVELLQFSTFILRDFLEKYGEKKESSQIRNFCLRFWLFLHQQIESQAKYEKLLETKS